MAAEPEGNRHLILIVEDRDDIRAALCSILTAGGYQVAEASGGRQAIDTARRMRPDMILLDLALPEINGLDVAQLLNQYPETAATPIVALTGSWLGSDPAALAEAGFVGALRKPFRAPELLAQISAVLEAARPGEPGEPNQQ